ncbi:hypothetical protein AJ80_04511 [Polytolypa hystricis UAMH7299]|uniref:Uncharacterized protein n=1 Tax=Polytolypa hystricis (strain UAMH7299) TaxID=1447883 RepID=A0A2B7YBC2_POLH7|nr:hypothetical protein AJ80_04511 [Polytolypa hystricis UAMH7299]
MANTEFARNFNGNTIKTSSSPFPPIDSDVYPPPQTSSSILTQSSFTDAIDTTLAPSTPLSGLSGPEYALPPQEYTSPKHPITSETAAYIRHAARASLDSIGLAKAMTSRTPSWSPPKPGRTTEAVQGQKRTANGKVKSPISPARLQRSPDTVRRIGRSRAMSTDSASGRIAELSAQLRARLSYAAAKVEKGRNLQSGDGSNGAHASLKHSTHLAGSLPLGSSNPSYSLNAATANTHSQSTSSSQTNGSYVFGGPLQPQQNKLANGSTRSSPTNNHIAYSPSKPNGQNGYHRKSASLDMSRVPRLAPPAGIVARNINAPRRRPNPNEHRHNYLSSPYYNHPRPPNGIPTIQETSNSSPSTTSNNTGSTVPGTPPQSQLLRPTSTPAAAAVPWPKQRTPSQNALMEQDAIETLLFMSSPENSGYHPNSQQSQRSDPSNLSFTTLPPAHLPEPTSSNGTNVTTDTQPISVQSGRPQLLSPIRPARKVSFVDDGGGADAGCITSQVNSYIGFEHEAGDEIDRMLDAMNDSDSDSEGDWVAQLFPRDGAQANGWNGRSARP